MMHRWIAVKRRNDEVNFGFNAGHGKSPSRITKRRMTTPQPGHSAGSDLRLAATPKPSYAER
jgi:hypothetical protein